MTASMLHIIAIASRIDMRLLAFVLVFIGRPPSLVVFTMLFCYPHLGAVCLTPAFIFFYYYSMFSAECKHSSAKKHDVL